MVGVFGASIRPWIVGTGHQFFGIAGDLVAIDFQFAFLANEDCSQSRPAIAIQVQSNLANAACFFEQKGTKETKWCLLGEFTFGRNNPGEGSV